MNKRLIDHRMKMLMKVVRRQQGETRAQRAIRAHERAMDQ